MTGLRAMLRLAARQSRQRPWHALLVVALVAVPAAAATFGSMIVRVAVDSPAESVANEMGTADAIVFAGSDALSRQALATLPADARTVAIHRTSGLATRAGGAKRVRIQLSDLPLTDPLTAGMERIRSGAAPAREGEAAASIGFLRATGTAVGDRVTLIRPPLTVRITGTLDRLARGDLSIVGPGLGGGEPTTILLDLPGGLTPQIATLANRSGMTRSTALGNASGKGRHATEWLYLAVALLLAAVGLITSAALSVGARRQLRTLGVLAASGGSPRHARQLVLAGGAVLGVAGALIGVALGVVVAFAARGSIESAIERSLADLRVHPADLVVIALLAAGSATAAAVLPARAAARTPVLASLAGRRPLLRLRRRIPLIGLAVSLLGCVVLATALAADNRDRNSAIAVGGCLLIVAGLVAWAPYLVGLLDRAAGRTTGTLRLAARTVARHRGRTGPTVAAVMAAGALAVAVATIALSNDESTRFDGLAALDPDLIMVDTLAAGGSGGCEMTPPSVIGAITAIAPARASACVTGSPLVFEDGTPVAIVDDIAALDLFRITSAAAALRNGAVIRLGGTATARVFDGLSRPVDVQVVAADPSAMPAQGITGLISRDAARRLGALPDDAVGQWLIHTASPLTAAQQRQLGALRDSDIGAQLSGPEGDVFVNIGFYEPVRSDVRRLTYGVLLPAAVLMALLVALIGLALTAAETREERATLVALGAGPGHRRGQHAWEAAIVTGLGGLLAVPCGLVPATILWKVENEWSTQPLTIPWVVIGALVVALPLIAAGGGALLTRARQPALTRRAA